MNYFSIEIVQGFSCLYQDQLFVMGYDSIDILIIFFLFWNMEARWHIKWIKMRNIVSYL